MAQEVEVPVDRNRDNLDPEFNAKLQEMEADLRSRGLEPVLIEGKRTKERQVWLWCSGRNRVGPIVTRQDGVQRKSLHQFGIAADYAFRDKKGKIYWPPTKAPEWAILEAAAGRAGLITGRRWSRFPDPGHVEMPNRSAE